MNALRLAWQLLRREARAGELHLLLAALVIAIAALTAVGFFTDRVAAALQQQATHLLGADLLVVSDHPLDKKLWRKADLSQKSVACGAGAARELQSPPCPARGMGGMQFFASNGIEHVHTQTFPSMVTHGDAAQLAEIKAVGAAYPLRGSLQIAAAPNAAVQVVRHGPAPGEVWLEPRLATQLGVGVGEQVQVGNSSLRVAALLMLEPDRGINFFSLAPRLIMALDDVAATALVQPGSRVTYRLLVAGEPAAVADYRARIAPMLGRGELIEDIQNARPELRQSLERAQRFLGLAAMLGVVLAAVAIALAARRHAERQLDGGALLRCLGMTSTRLRTLYLAQLLLIALGGVLAGCSLGWLAHYFLVHAAAAWLPADLPAPGMWPLWQGLGVGGVLLLFALPALMQLARVPPLRVLRRDVAVPRGSLYWYALGGLGLAALLLLRAAEVKLGLWVLAGFAVALLVFGAAAGGLLALVARLPLAGLAWRHGRAGLLRHRGTAIVQIVALGLGFMALLLLTVTRGELLLAWQKTTPPDAPNHFVINIQPDQLALIRTRFAAAGLQPEFAPMVRARLMRVNGRPVSAADYSEERAQRLVEREFNLSWRSTLPPANRITAGQWFSAAANDEASVEEGLARTLGLRLGDALEFDLAGSPVVVRISSLRKLDWDSMRVNFFVLTPPGVLEPHPQSLITSFHLPPEQRDFVPALVARFPNLTVIDIGAILQQLRAVIDQAASALQGVFAFTLAAGLIVLYAALANGLDARRRELAILRALGAREAQLKAALHVEFACIGGFAGLIAALACLLVGAIIARQVFQFDLAPAWWLPPAAALGGALLVPLAARLATADLHKVSPLEALRET